METTFSNISNNMDNAALTKTYVDDEIAELEKQGSELQAEITRLLAGQLTANGLDGQLVQVDLSGLIVGNTATVSVNADEAEQVVLDEQQINLKLQQLLADNPIYQQIVNAFKTQQQIKEDLVIAGIIPSTIEESEDENGNIQTQFAPITPGLRGKLVLANYRFSKLTSHKFAGVGSFLNSKWLLVAALLIFMLWGGGWLLFATLHFGGDYVVENNNTTSTNNTYSSTSTGPYSNLATPSIKNSNSPTTPVIKNNKSGLQNGTYDNNNAIEANYIVAEPFVTVGSNNSNTVTATETPLATDATTTTTIAAQTTTAPILTTTAAPTVITSDINSNNNGGNGNERVGLPPSAAGGFNGPHGAFLAPSQMAVAALNLNVPIERAIIDEQDTWVTITAPTNPTASATTNTTASPIITDIASTIFFAPTSTPQQISVTMQPQLTLTWPRPGQVTQLGAYPGELGNCILLGTQESLAPLRYLQIGDEVSLNDRKNNRFIYRVVPFSAANLPERIVNPATDTWLFDQPNNLAELTIIVNMPQPLPPINYAAMSDANNGGGSSSSSNNNQGQNNGLSRQDDYTAKQKLAYRAILVSYVPNSTAALVGTPVAVPAQAWQAPPIPTPTPTLSTIAASSSSSNIIASAAGTKTANPSSPSIANSPPPPNTTSDKNSSTPTVSIPNGLPDTGNGDHQQ